MPAAAVDVALIVTIATLLDTIDTVGVMPNGCVAAVVPSALVNQANVPTVLSDTSDVLTENEHWPIVPLVIVPDWNPKVTGQGLIMSVQIVETAWSSVNVK